MRFPIKGVLSRSPSDGAWGPSSWGLRGASTAFSRVGVRLPAFSAGDSACFVRFLERLMTLLASGKLAGEHCDLVGAGYFRSCGDLRNHGQRRELSNGDDRSSKVRQAAVAAGFSGRDRRPGGGLFDRSAARPWRRRVSGAERAGQPGGHRRRRHGRRRHRHARPQRRQYRRPVRCRRHNALPAPSRPFPRRGATKIFASCSTRKPSTSTPSPSARPTISTLSPPWPPSAPANTCTARNLSRTRCTNAGS